MNVGVWFMKKDRGFDGLVHHFDKNIYGRTKGWLRERVLWQELIEGLDLQTDVPLNILDCGGGTGRISLRLAKLGHHITVNDLSAQMLEKCEFLFKEHGLEQNLNLICSPFQVLPEDHWKAYDLVLCHAVLEWLAKPEDALPMLAGFLKPGGTLSLMVYNQHALDFHKVIKTHYFHIDHPTPPPRKSKLTPPNPQDPKAVINILENLGLEVVSTAGIRIFYDYLENGDRYEGIPDELVNLELLYRSKFPFCWFGRYVHIMAQKPGHC